MFNIIKNRKIPFTISGTLFILSVIILLVFGFKPGIDFTGGSLLEIKFSEKVPESSEIENSLKDLDLGSVQIQKSEEDKLILRMKFLSEEDHQLVLNTIREDFGGLEQIVAEEIIKEMEDANETPEKEEVKDVNVEDIASGELKFELPTSETNNESVGEYKNTEEENAPSVIEERFETIGPAVSANLRERSMYAAIAVIIAIILFIGYAFRKVSKPVQSWKYGITAIIALVHDVAIVMAIFSLLGRFAGVEVGIPFVVALLTIMGYSVNDTIVVFDRVRENLIKRGNSDEFDVIVNTGVNQSITRSINTSLTTLLVLFALFIFGGDSIHYFSLALILGVLAGTYSSIFLASPLLVVWSKIKK
jgi:preprotein translocase subunit SecF